MPAISRTYVETDGGLKDLGTLIEIISKGENYHYLTPWEQEFADDMSLTYAERRTATNWISLNQTNIIIRVYNKLIAAEAEE